MGEQGPDIESPDEGRDHEPDAGGAASDGPLTSEHAFNALADRFPRDNLNVLVHFYRGELGRAIAWRQKMDMTTHWAIITATALVSVSFSNQDVSHVVLLFASALIFLLLNIEGRRYRFFDVWRTRVRMLEVHFIVPAIAFEHRLPQGNWREVLCNDLFKPTYKISYWEAVGRRLQRNYVWLFAITSIAWISKVYLASGTGGFWNGFGVTGIDASGAPVTLVDYRIVIGVGLAFNGLIAALCFHAWRTRTATGEIRRKQPDQKVWPI